MEPVSTKKEETLSEEIEKLKNDIDDRIKIKEEELELIESE